MTKAEGNSSAFSSPVGQGFVFFGFAFPGEGNAAGKQHGFFLFIPGAVLMVTHERKTMAGKLYPDLMAAAGVQPDTHQTFFPGAEGFELQPGFFYASAFFFDNENLVFAAVLEQKKENLKD